MVEAISNSAEDHLIDGLSFKIKPGASYVTRRSQSTYWASGSNVYGATVGTKVIFVLLSGDQWLDPSTVRLNFTLNNLDGGEANAHLLRPVSGPWCFFRRVRVLCGGAIIDDIDSYNRIDVSTFKFKTKS